MALFKTKRQIIFAVVSQFLGRDSASIAINLTEKKILKKAEKTRAISGNFENNMLKFGNEEITIKNNGSL